MKTSKNIVISILTILLLSNAVGVMHVPLVRAQSGSFSGTGQEAFCRSGSRNWGDFVSAVISYDDFKEYWKDIFVRYNANMCLYQDIDNILKRVTTVRAQIRKAFFACDNAANALKKTYYQLQAELFFLRKFIDIGNGQIIIKPDKEVYNALRSYFVIEKNVYSEAEVKKLFDGFVKKYKDPDSGRIEAYANCKDPSWGSLVSKWNELGENVRSAFGLKSSPEAPGKRFDKVTNAPLDRTGNALAGSLDVKVNGVDPLTGFSDIGAELKKNFPKGFTYEQLQAANEQELQRYDDDITRADYLGQYEHLYRSSSGETVNEIVGTLKTLEKILKETFPYINQTAQCTKGILDRAC